MTSSASAVSMDKQLQFVGQARYTVWRVILHPPQRCTTLLYYSGAKCKRCWRNSCSRRDSYNGNKLYATDGRCFFDCWTNIRFCVGQAQGRWLSLASFRSRRMWKRRSVWPLFMPAKLAPTCAKSRAARDVLATQYSFSNGVATTTRTRHKHLD